MMKRTKRDGSFAKLMTGDNVHPDVGSTETKAMVSKKSVHMYPLACQHAEPEPGQ